MDDATQARIAALEDRIADLSEELATTRSQLAEAQLDQWKGRIDEIEVQLALGRMETEEQLRPVLDQLRDHWLDAQRQVRSAVSPAGDVFSALRNGVESAWGDVRAAVRDARRSSD